jgi:hypothetical protein
MTALMGIHEFTAVEAANRRRQFKRAGATPSIRLPYRVVVSFDAELGRVLPT